MVLDSYGSIHNVCFGPLSDQMAASSDCQDIYFLIIWFIVESMQELYFREMVSAILRMRKWFILWV